MSSGAVSGAAATSTGTHLPGSLRCTTVGVLVIAARGATVRAAAAARRATCAGVDCSPPRSASASASGGGFGSARSPPSASRRSSCSCIQTVWYESSRGDVSHSVSPSSTRPTRRAAAGGTRRTVRPRDRGGTRPGPIRSSSACSAIDAPTSRSAGRGDRSGRRRAAPASRCRRAAARGSAAGSARTPGARPARRRRPRGGAPTTCASPDPRP